MPCPEKFADSLVKFGIEQSIIDEIFDGYEGIVSKTLKKKKAAFFKRATDILDEKADRETVREIYDWNACCKSGARERNSKEFARINANLSIEQKFEKIRKAPYMNMGRPYVEGDGLIRIDAVSYFPNDRFACACSNFNRVERDYPVSKTYCYCCGGHFRYHYEIMLGLKLKVKEVVSSPLDSDGKNPCVFLLEILK